MGATMLCLSMAGDDVSAWLAITAARSRNIPCMITGDTNYIYDKDNPWLKAVRKESSLESAFSQHKGFSCYGAVQPEVLRNYGVSDRKFFFAPLPVDTEYFMQRAESARPRKGELRARYGIPADVVLAALRG